MRLAADALDQLLSETSNDDEGKSISDDDSIIHLDLDSCDEDENGSSFIGLVSGPCLRRNL